MAPWAEALESPVIRSFISDWREWSLATAVWNLRFQLGWAVLPGERKHVQILDEEPV